MLAVIWTLCLGGRIEADDLYLQHARDSIRLGNRFLQSVQNDNGQFPADGFLVHPVASTALGTLALMKSAESFDRPGVMNGMSFLRSLPDDEPRRINELSLLILNFNLINSPDDRPRVATLVRRLIDQQLPSGSWPHRIGEPVGDLSATEFAVIALRDCVQLGYEIPVAVWERSRAFWTLIQNADGGWPEFFNEADPSDRTSPSRISGTLAGVAMLSCCEYEIAVAADRTESDRPLSSEESEALKRGRQWLMEHCSTTPGPDGDSQSGLDHLYGLERSFRPHGALFLGEEQWFRHHAVSMLRRQHRSHGFWPGNHQAMSTSYALIALSSGVSQAQMTHVLLEGNTAARTRQRSPRAVWDLNERFLGIQRSHRLGVPHELDFRTLRQSETQPEPFLESPVLFLTGIDALQWSNRDLARLKSYVNQGGLLLIAPEAASEDFLQGIRKLARGLADPYDGELSRVPEHHPVMSAMFQLPVEQTELWELNTGCRTVLLYSRLELPVAWSLRSHQRTAESELAVHIGMNVLAYAGNAPIPPSRPPSNTRSEDLLAADPGLLKVGQVHITNTLPTPPDSLKNLFQFVNQNAGSLVASEPSEISLDDKRIAHFPVLYWHGAHAFTLSADQCQTLRQHLDRGGVLIADACCGSPEFDRAFRRAMTEVYPERSLTAISADHEVGGTETFFDLSETRWQPSPRAPDLPGVPLPVLEGIDHAGRYAVIYSPFDLSCAWQSTGRRDCASYDSRSALKVGTNLLIYSLKQELKAIPVSRASDQIRR